MRLTSNTFDTVVHAIASDGHMVTFRYDGHRMGDAHMSSSGLMFSMDAQTFHTNFLQNINDDQVKGCQHNPKDPFVQPCTGPAVAQAAGAVPDVSPFQTSPYGSNPGSVVWQSAYPVIARNMWRHYGDAAVIKNHCAFHYTS